MIKLFSVFLGGGIGAIFRYLISLISQYFGIQTIFATFCVNIIGSFILGFVFAFAVLKSDFSPILKIFITVGFCGGLTTFSTFSSECFYLLNSGKIFEFIIYMFSSVFICIIATGLGVYCAKII
jgi:CrcB protein